MDAVEFIRDVTYKMCDRDFDLDLVESTFADDFVHHGNGATTDRAGYLARGREYREQFASIDRPQFGELFAVDDRVVAAYTLALHRRDGSTERKTHPAAASGSRSGLERTPRWRRPRTPRRRGASSNPDRTVATARQPHRGPSP